MRDKEFAICSWQFTVFLSIGITDCQLKSKINKEQNAQVCDPAYCGTSSNNR